MQMRVFTTADWNTWAGANRCADGTEPMIAECETSPAEGVSRVVIVDRDGLCITEVCVDDEGELLIQFAQLQMSFNGALRIATAMTEEDVWGVLCSC